MIIPILTATRSAGICSATVKRGEAVSAVYTPLNAHFAIPCHRSITRSRISSLSVACFPPVFLKISFLLPLNSQQYNFCFMFSSPDSEEPDMRNFGLGLYRSAAGAAACRAARKSAGHANAAFSSGDFS
jgi:hypothetical protein